MSNENMNNSEDNVLVSYIPENVLSNTFISFLSYNLSHYFVYSYFFGFVEYFNIHYTNIDLNLRYVINNFIPYAILSIILVIMYYNYKNSSCQFKIIGILCCVLLMVLSLGSFKNIIIDAIFAFSFIFFYGLIFLIFKKNTNNSSSTSIDNSQVVLSNTNATNINNVVSKKLVTIQKV